MFKRPEEFLSYVSDLMTVNMDNFGIQYVGDGTQNLIPAYPAVDVTVGKVNRRIHATQQFEIIVDINLWIYHANLNVSHQVRTYEDLHLVTQIVELLHSLRTGNGPNPNDTDFVDAFVQDEDPGIQPKKSGAVVTTRILWCATGRVPYSLS